MASDSTVPVCSLSTEVALMTLSVFEKFHNLIVLSNEAETKES